MNTIAGRIWLQFLISAAAIGALVGMLYLQMGWSDESSRQAARSEETIFEVRLLVAEMSRSEVLAHEYLQTGADGPRRNFVQSLKSIEESLSRLDDLGSDFPDRAQRLRPLRPAVQLRIAQLEDVIRLRAQGNIDEAKRAILSDQASVQTVADRILAAQIERAKLRNLENQRMERNELLLLVIGSPAVFALLLFGTLALRRRIKHPLAHLLEGTARIAGGELGHQIKFEHKDEIGRLVEGFNGMSTTLAKERAELEQAQLSIAANNQQLHIRGLELERRSEIIQILGKMAHRLETCQTRDEFCAVISCFAPQVVIQMPGALALFANSRNRLEVVASWNNPAACVELFSPSDCWALRSGHLHIVDNENTEIPCLHLNKALPHGYRCLPLIAQGELAGSLYFEHTDLAREENLDHWIDALTENISLALANFRLRQTLRDQSIRDPLTDLFNRRFVEESLGLELARAARAGTSVGMVMIDVDNFKYFNDTYGHEGGDAALRAVARVLEADMRKGDTVCRYGGEEFLLILPGASAAQSIMRTELLAKAIREMTLNHAGRLFEKITISAGVGIFPDDGESAEAVISAADVALYAAKAAGRNRVYGTKSAAAPDPAGQIAPLALPSAAG